MARPSLPTLTWNKSSVLEYANADGRMIITGISSSVAASTHWQVISANTGAGNHYYVEVGPKASTAGVGKQRIVFASTGTGSWAGSPDNVMGPYGTAATRTAGPTTGEIMAFYAPEGADGTKIASFPDNPSAPSTPHGAIYGESTRSIGFYGISEPFTGTTTAKVWIIESAEILAVAIEDSTNSYEYGGIWGPMWIGATTAAADVDTTDRIYGGAWFGDNVGITFWTATNNAFMDSGVAFNSFRTCCFDPDTESEIYALYMMTSRNAIDAHNLVSKSGTYVALDVNHYAFDTKGDGTLVPDEYIGTLRQIRMGRDFTSRILVQDSGGNTEAIVWGSHPTTNYSAIWFTNS